MKDFLDRLLVADWRLAHKWWSVRFLIIGAVLDGVGMALPAFTDKITPARFLTLSLAVSIATLAARLVAQNDQPAEK